ncbi:MAG: anaerobic ribonucleoside-triphosphate reductase activating protein [Clostridiales bacterium]|nr:anaerobic ribonucleoside-triphosphate reductase activating protein [Clostridiales bacterium]
MNYAEIRKFDVTNGPNVRTTLFVSGCTNNCKGCFNKDLQDFSYGSKWTSEIEDKFLEYVKNENVKGVNILGGEPMEQIMDNDLYNLLQRIKKDTNKDIWLWTGFLIEDILKDEKKKKILNCVDVLIDGRFDINKRDISLKYRGSSNQRVIDVKKTLVDGNIVTII